MKNFLNKNSYFFSIISYIFIFLIFILISNYYNVFSISHSQLDSFIGFRDILINFFNTGKLNFFSFDVFLGND